MTTRSCVADEAGEDVQQRRLAGAGAARDDDVQAAGDRRLQEVAASAAVHDSRPTRSSAPSRSVRKRRIDSTGPSSASGGMMALTREPSARRASTIGLDSSMRRPTMLTMRSMICRRCRSSLNDDVGRLELAVPLDVDLVVAVDEDVRDRRIAQQSLERAEAEQLVQDVGDERLALEQAERRLVALALEHAADQARGSPARRPRASPASDDRGSAGSAAPDGCGSSAPGSRRCAYHACAVSTSSCDF